MSLDHGPTPQTVERAAYTIAEFCTAHRISRSKLYQLWAAGRGPRKKKTSTRRSSS
jgi:hypothetical protein